MKSDGKKLHTPMVHQCQPHLNHLALHELMFVDLDDIGDPTVISMLDLEDLEVVVIVDLTFYGVINTCIRTRNDSDMHLRMTGGLSRQGVGH
jgi:hypothetical protein